ncbi:Rhodanese-like protein [Fructilactobacillus florum 8D]|uniref:Rhodanese-like protein n=1 Tax=Fructilactobacillus florum 8D TaxID=1221538 RepID=W9EKG6_9LACO|nr:rhodanese-like domain-containing protein [Fructilactobacillus florum]EKK20708.1 Rhodanese-like protein [Fructilactobacillus florum 2F]ETO40174.1 Rhodanese-like protein [Fructilactobacillus florum 8D]
MIIAAGFLSSLTTTLVVIVIIMAGWSGYRYLQKFLLQRYVNFLSEADFQKGIRTAQVIDLRESKSFAAGHILGARNIPYASFRTVYHELRPDLPVFLYDQTKTLSIRAAKLLHKQGYQQISILNEGYQRWDGKIKKD